MEGKIVALTDRQHLVAEEGVTASAAALAATCGGCPHTYEHVPEFPSSHAALCHLRSTGTKREYV